MSMRYVREEKFVGGSPVSGPGLVRGIDRRLGLIDCRTKRLTVPAGTENLASRRGCAALPSVRGWPLLLVIDARISYLMYREK